MYFKYVFRLLVFQLLHNTATGFLLSSASSTTCVYIGLFIVVCTATQHHTWSTS